MSETIEQMLERHEGKKNKPYKCSAGKTTIGIGRNLDDVGVFEDEIALMFANDVKRTQIALLKALPWIIKLDNNRSNVLIDMGFNLGVPGLLKFKNFLAAMERGDWETACSEMKNSAWYGQVTNRAEDLIKLVRG